MKKLRKVFSLLLVLSLVLSCGMASAASSSEETVLDSEVVYSDGKIEILIVTVPAGAGMNTRAYADDESGTATPVKYYSYTCLPTHGNNCRVAVDNTDAENTMRVTFDYAIDNASHPISIAEDAAPGTGKYTLVRNTDGSVLNCTIETTIRAVGASSVDYTYYVSQYQY